MRRSKLALDLVALVGLLLLLVNPAAAAPPPARQAFSSPVLAANPLAPKPTPTVPGVRPKAAGTTATTTTSGPVEPSAGELVSLRTRTSRTYATADGNEAFLYSESVNYQPTPGAAWQKIDNSLVASGTTYHNAANRYTVTVPATLGQGPVKLQVGASWLTLSLTGASGTATASVGGNEATFADALPNANLVVAAGGDAIEAALVLTAATAPASYTFSLATSSDLSIKQSGNTISVVAIATGQPLLTIPPAGMADSSGSPAGTSTSVSQTLTTAPGATTLTVAADPAYLASPARAYPVTIDPSVTLNATGACRIETDLPNQGFCGGFVRAGFNGTSTWRPVLQFDLSGIPQDSVVLDAALNLDAYAFGSNLAMLVNLQQVTQGWNSNVTWNTYDGVHNWRTPGGDFLGPPVWSQTVPATVGWNSWGLSQLAQGWVDGSITNDGLLLKEADESLTNTQDYHGNESLFQDKKPTMTVLYAPYLGDGQPWYALRGQGLTDRMGVAVNVENGNLVLHANDVAIAGTAGFNLGLDRWYNGLADELNSPGSDSIRDLGVNWVMNNGFDVRLRPGKDGIAYYGPGGFAVHFQRQQQGTFTSPPGIDATLSGNNPYTLTFHQTGVVYTFSHPSSQGGDILLTSMADQDGNTITFNYVQNEDALASIVDSQGRAITPTYTNGYLTKLTDWTGRSWQYTIDANNDLTQYTDPANGVTKYTYDATNHQDLTQVQDPKGNLTQITYLQDGTHRVSQITFGYQSNPDVHGTYSFTYNQGNTVVTDPNNHQTTYYFGTVNDTSLLTKVTDALGNSFQYSYTSDNHVHQYTDAKNQVFTDNYSTDGNNNLTSVVPPTGATESWAYADTSHPYYPTAITDTQGNTVSVAYDAAGNVHTVSTPAMVNSQTTVTTITQTIDHNPNGTVKDVVDFNGNETTYGYDSAGNLTSITPPAYTPGPGSQQLGPTTITPDALSRSHVVADGKGQTATYTFDALDRVTNIQYLDGSIAYLPDADGDILSMTDGTGTTTYQYDARNRQTQKTLPAGGGTFSYGFDAASNLVSYADAGGTVTYHYNAGDELDYLLEPSGAKTSFQYDPDHARTTTSYPDGVTMTFGYDNSGRVSTVTAVNASTTLVGLTYGYTNPSSGKDTSLVYTITENDAPGVGPFPTRQFTTTQAYDPRNLQLSWVVKQTGNGAVVHDYEYQFDANGNRTQIVADATVSPPPAVPTTGLAYNAVNELLTTTLYNGSGQQVNQATWYYDAAGNQTGNSGYPGTSQPLAITYNQHDQTASITDAYQHPVAMTWTGAGQAERTSADWSNEPSPPTGQPAEYGPTTYTNAALGLMSQTNSNGTTYYTRDPGGLPISERKGSTSYYYVYDGQGNVAMLVDPPSGAPVSLYDPCPTGNQAGNGWAAPGFADDNLWQRYGAMGVAYDAGTKDLLGGGTFWDGNSQNPTSLPICNFLGFISLLCPPMGAPGQSNVQAQTPAPTALRVQLQASPISGGVTTETHAQALSDEGSGRGVTALQVREALLNLTPFVPNSIYGDFYNAVVQVSKFLDAVVAGGGWSGDQQRSFPFAVQGRKEWRIDLENLRGWNLRFQQ